jgi:hypothetical protein
MAHFLPCGIEQMGMKIKGMWKEKREDEGIRKGNRGGVNIIKVCYMHV